MDTDITNDICDAMNDAAANLRHGKDPDREFGFFRNFLTLKGLNKSNILDLWKVVARDLVGVEGLLRLLARGK